MSHYTPPKQDSLTKVKCSKCYREYTKSMMMQINEYAQRYLCIRCYNRKEYNANNTRNVIS